MHCFWRTSWYSEAPQIYCSLLQANQQTNPNFVMLRGPFNPSPAIHRMMLKRTGESFSNQKDGYYQASYLPSCYTNPSLPCFGSLINGWAYFIPNYIQSWELWLGPKVWIHTMMSVIDILVCVLFLTMLSCQTWIKMQIIKVIVFWIVGRNYSANF